MTTLRLLLVEDNEVDAKLVVRELSKGRQLEWRRVDTRQAMQQALAEGPWDLVVSDWSMPHFSAREALVALKEAGLETPFIIVSGTVGEDVAVEAMRAGARDFIAKGKLARLAPAVERELEQEKARASARRAERALKLSEARFQRLSESGVVGIVLADLTGKVHDANDAFLSTLGYTRADLASGSIPWNTLVPAETTTADEQAILSLQTTGAARPWEKELLHRDGHRVPVLMGVAMLDDTNVIGFTADVSERRRAEAELHRSQEQLRQAQKLEAIGSLAGGIAHDFNNLLTVILSYSLMAHGELPEDHPLRGDLREIHRAGERAAALTGQLLAFSRRQVLQPRVLDLDEVLARMERLLRRLIGEEIQLSVMTGTGGARVKVDPSQLEQVVMNLVVNARDAMPKGGTLIVKTAAVQLDEAFARSHVGVTPGPHVLLAVSDTGTGMDAATQARMFDPFFTTKEPGKGTGLGLSTVLGIVQQSQATIWVDSTLGVGTTFTVYFKAVADTVADTAAPAPLPGELKGSETVLLVEDDAPARGVVSTILRRSGYEVLEAQTAGDALILSEQYTQQIHLLLTDVVMPLMSGRQLAERLVKSRTGMKVLFMSGYTDDQVVRHGVMEATVNFLAKPVTPLSLLQKVRQVLDAS